MFLSVQISVYPMYDATVHPRLPVSLCCPSSLLPLSHKTCAYADLKFIVPIVLSHSVPLSACLHLCCPSRSLPYCVRLMHTHMVDTQYSLYKAVMYSYLSVCISVALQPHVQIDVRPTHMQISSTVHPVYKATVYPCLPVCISAVLKARYI